MYCKFPKSSITNNNSIVLIVAKCIVNLNLPSVDIYYHKVLIVAKCIVNSRNVLEFLNKYVVLIVAKCIVN